MTTGPTLITLFTDAGFCPRTRLASWAMWAKADGVAIRRSGMFLERPIGSDVAELKAMANGISLVISIMRPAHGAKIIAQTDFIAIVSAMTAPKIKRAKTRDRWQAAIDVVRDKLARSGVTVEYRHVKGHKGTKTPRNAVNTECDKECRRLLKEARRIETERQSENVA